MGMLLHLSGENDGYRGIVRLRQVPHGVSAAVGGGFSRCGKVKLRWCWSGGPLCSKNAPGSPCIIERDFVLCAKRLVSLKVGVGGGGQTSSGTKVD